SEINANLAFREKTFNFTSPDDLTSISSGLQEILKVWLDVAADGLLVRWDSGDSLNLGVIYSRGGVVVLRYVVIDLR
ncbi:MAG: hypothetical protein QXX57_05985, partial [Nitrososphaerota archaeon]